MFVKRENGENALSTADLDRTCLAGWKGSTAKDERDRNKG